MKILAHRGASGEFPENSLLAFEQAIIQEADGIELDAQFHGESQQFIILHDNYLDSTTNGRGHYNLHSLEELTRLSLGENQKLITLQKALEKIAGRVIVNIELKTITSDKNIIKEQIFILKKVLEASLQRDGFSPKQFIISSFNHHMILACKKLLPNISTAALIAHNPIDFANLAQKLKCDVINPEIDCLDPAIINDAHQKGLEVWVYTVDRAEDISLCHQLKVDAIFTNFPENARKILKTCKAL